MITNYISPAKFIGLYQKKVYVIKRTAILFAALLAVMSPASSKPLCPAKAETKELHVINLHWLEKSPAKHTSGVSFGVPWKKGELPAIKNFTLKNDDTGESVPVQTWVLAYWPDGSIKWTAHAAGADIKNSASLQLIENGLKIKQATPLAGESDKTININTGAIKCTINKTGNTIISSIERQGTEIARDGKLVMIKQSSADTDSQNQIEKTSFEGLLEKVTLEQNGPLRVVVKLEGKHISDNSTTLLPYIVRLYFYKGSEAIRIMHTIIYDGDENKDFIKGLGIQFSVPMHKEELYNRHIRFVGENNGVFAEAVKGLTGLRRDPGQKVRETQIQGKETLPADSFPDNVSRRLQFVPAFGDYTLSQLSNNAFSIRKRTKEGYSWLSSAFGKRSSGTGYVGTPSGGLAFGIRNFWQSYPAQLDIKNAATDEAKVILWLWAPDAQSMDLRFYHDGMGQDTYDLQNEGLDITYEDYEPGFSTPHGIARTSEVSIWALGATPSNGELADIAASIQNPSVLLCSPEYLQQQGVFGDNWSLPDYSTPAKKQTEERLDWNLNFYQKQIEQRGWYGFWNFGDVMHSYDADRHVWKYDIGGFAWDNSELSTDLWLWYSFLRTGRADIFRMAEAMTRHTGEVDVYHIGRFAPLGSRHNVMHWGCSAKQLRISTAANRRFLYYLTADERIGDLLHEQVDGVKKLHDIVATRKRISEDPRTKPANIVLSSFGTDWGAVAAAWLTEWERTRNPEIKEKLINSMKTIAAQPKKFFTGSGYMDVNTGKFEISKSNKVTASHLNAVFGLTEICEELIQSFDVPAFRDAWLQYCRLYNASKEEQEKELGASHEEKAGQEHSRLTAYAAWYYKDNKLAERSWSEFNGRLNPKFATQRTKIKTIYPPEVLNPVDENPYISTNEIAQWGLSAIQCLRYVGDSFPE